MIFYFELTRRKGDKPMGIISRTFAINGQKRHGFKDGKAGKKPSFFRSSLAQAAGDDELKEAYDEAYRQGQQARRNEELSK